jgi:predicted SAM-dependent methyltransferase
MSYVEGQSALRECYRVLKCGGRVRIATPNLNYIAALCTPAKGGAQERYIRLSIAQHGPHLGSHLAGFVVNNFFRQWGHEFIYDPETMELALRTSGFSGFRWFAVGESEDENLRGIEGHHRCIGEEQNRFETMVVEATRPQTDCTPAGKEQAQPRSGL